MSSLLRRLMGVGKRNEEEEILIVGEPAAAPTPEPEPINGSCLRDALERRRKMAELHSYSGAERERILAEAQDKEEVEILMAGEPPLRITGSFPTRRLPGLTGESTGEHLLGNKVSGSTASRRVDTSAMTIVSVVDYLKGRPLDERFAREIMRAISSHLLENDTSIEQFMDQFDMTEEEKTAETLALEALAKKMSEYWTDVDFDLDPERFGLAGAQSLTIYRPATAGKPGFAKKSHIGGEDFIPVRSYVGKRGAIVCVFKPVAVEDYATMEMPLQECFQSLSGFQRYFVEAGLSTDLNAITEARNAKKKAEDMAKFGERYEDFGSF